MKSLKVIVKPEKAAEALNNTSNWKKENTQIYSRSKINGKRVMLGINAVVLIGIKQKAIR